jgi:soluble lytic murein transglycosylase-like protein
MKHRHEFPPIKTWSEILVYGIYLTLILLALIYVNDSKADETQTIQDTIVKVAMEEGIDPALALAIAETESNFNPKMIGSLGEIGVYQLRPEFHRVSRSNVSANIKTGIKYLVRLKRECNSYGDAFFVCFNYGQAKKLKYPKLFPYYKKVMIAKQRRESNLIAEKD